MELVGLEDQVRSGAQVTVRHRHTDLARGLEHGEAIVVESAGGERHAARVTGIDLEIADTVYTVAVGVRLPDELARERIAGLDPIRHDLTLHQVVDLLGDLRLDASE